MSVKKKTVQLLSSDKDKLKKNAALLPVKTVEKPKITGSGEPVKLTEKTVNEPVETGPEINALVEQIKATGVLKNVFCNGFDFVLNRTKKTRLTADEKVMLEEPLNKIEVKLLEMLPEFIRKQADKGGPIIDLTAAVIMIVWAKNQEAKTSKPPEPAKAKVESVNPAPSGTVSPIDAVNPPKETVVNLN